MEGIGVVLAVLPLVISAIEHYDFFAPFICHCAFTRELQNFRRKLDARKLLFRNECRLLLESLVQDDVLEEMFKEGSKHPSWGDTELDGRLKGHLGESYEVCVGMVVAIKGCIDQLKHKTRGLGVILAPEAGTEVIGDKRWRQRVGNYIKLALRKERLDEDLDELKELNEDLSELSRQIRELKRGQQRRAANRADKIVVTRKAELSGFRTVRQTSENLYHALSKVSACMAHNEHSATLCIDARPLKKSYAPRVKFNVAFAASMNGPVWINIESTITGTSAQGTIQVVQSAPKSHALVRCLKRQIEADESDDTISAKSLRTTGPPALQIQSPSPSQVTQSTEVMGHTDAYTKEGIPDLSTQNFCFHIQQNGHPAFSSDMCAGYLREGVCDHLVYYPPYSDFRKSEAQSLAHIISLMSDEWPLSRYSRLERIRLAKVLAKAVLEYHDTPWLRDSWRSNDIQFFADSSQSIADLGAPHLTVRFPSRHGTFSRLGPADKGSAYSDHAESFAQNNTLFGLATMLLELDFEKPLSHMRLPGDVVENPPQGTEFKTAKRLAKSTIPGLGPDFRKIIRKCLHCSFGLDETDLKTSEELKQRVHQEVVCELESLEKALASCTVVDTRS